MSSWAEKRIDELNAAVVAGISAGAVADALPLAEEALRLARAYVGPEDPRYGFALNNLSQAYAHGGDLAAAIPLAQEAAQHSREQFGERSAEHATLLANAGLLLAQAERLDEALVIIDRALTLRRVVEGEHGEGVADLLFDRANLLRRLQRPDEAAADFRAGVAVYRMLLAPDDPQLIRVIVALLELLADAPDDAPLQSAVDEAVDAARDALGDEPARLVAHLRALAVACAAPRLLQAAARALEAAAPLAVEPSVRVDVLVDLAMVQHRSGLDEDAEATLARAREDAGTADTTERGRVLRASAEVLLDRGHAVAAEAELRAAVGAFREDPPEDRDLVADTLARLAQASALNQNFQAAERALREALALRTSRLGAAHPATAETREWLGLTLERLGDRDSAIALHDDALAAFRAGDPGSLRPLEAAAELLTRAGRAQEALGHREAALAIARDLGDEYAGFLVERLASTAAARRATGALSGARTLLEEEVALLDRTGGAGSAASADALRRLADVLDELGLEEEAVQRRDTAADVFAALGHHAEAATVARATLGWVRASGDTQRLTAQLNRVAEYARQAHDLTVAEPLYCEVLRLLEDRVDVSLERATVLNNLGLLRAAQGDPAAAAELYERALSMTEGDDAALPRAFLLNNLASALLDTGDIDRAATLADESLALRTDVFGARSVQVATALSTLGQVRFAQGDAKGAVPPLQASIQIHLEQFGPNHPQLGRAVGTLAGAKLQTGELDDAEQLFDWAYVIALHSGGERSGDASAALSGLAVAAGDRGDTVRARDLHARALAIAEQVFGPEHPEVASLAINLAEALLQLEDHRRAEALLDRALRILQGGTPGPDLQRALGLLSRVYFATGRAETLEVGRAAFDLARTLYPADHPDAARAMNDYAALVVWFAPAEGRALLEQALATRRKVLGDDHPLVAETLNNLAMVQLGQGDREAAARSFSDALAIRLRVQTETNPDVIRVRSNLAATLAPTQPGEALRHMALADAALEQVLAGVYAHGSEDERTAFVDVLIRHRDLWLSIVAAEAARDQEAVTAAFDMVLRRKGLLGEALTAQRDAVTTRYPALVPKLAELAGLRSEVTALRLRADAADAAAPFSAQADAADSRRRALEAEIARQIPDIALRQRLRGVGHANVTAVLGTHTALLELVRYRRTDARADDLLAMVQSPRYLAFVLYAGTVRMVDLGDADALDAEAAALRRGLSGDVDLDAAVAGLGTALMAPLAEALGDARTLVIAPDGDLAMLPFELLPLPDGRSVLEAFVVSYVGSGRELMRVGADAPAAGAPVVVADPDFNLGGTRRNAPWTPLSGTYEEGRRVAERLGVTLLTGADATEGALKRVRSPSVLHLATHGFFHADEEDEALLLRAGLVLAGANTASAGETPPAEAQDGVLTADDVAQLDLLGTHVVVLSACETGLGRVQAGEGVLGLRRAFVLAGADTIVMSLWKVPDYESLELMDAFYDRLLAGAGRAEALRDARRELRDAGHSAAAYGAFICQGDPGPLPAGALTPR